MNDWPRLVAVVAGEGFELRLTYSDGFVGVVDFAETVATGGIFAFLQNPERFASVRVAHNGSALRWIDDEGDEIDFDAEAQRIRAEAAVVATLARA